MKKTRVAINGFGRIGRAFLKQAHNREELEIVAINDLGDIENLAYLLKYDTVYGISELNIKTTKEGEEKLIINGNDILFLSEPDPKKLPWGDLNIDIVIESTGVFNEYNKAKAHIDAGAKKVVISAPGKGDGFGGEEPQTVLVGVNTDKLKTSNISSNASCTTNAGSPVMTVLAETVGIKKALLNTVHGYTASQSIVDSPQKDKWRRGRAGAQNIVPSTTGAATATAKALTELEGKFDGVALRVPVISGSIADITFISGRDTTVEEINNIFKKASTEERWKGILTVTEDPIVSVDIIGNTHASIIDLDFTRVVGGNLVKVLAWYDNEYGYTHTLIEHVVIAGKLLK